jgi:hypothetical protein
MWKYVVQTDRPQMTIIRRMRFACWITKATDTHSEYVIPLSRQQLLRERATILRLHAHCLCSLSLVHQFAVKVRRTVLANIYELIFLMFLSLIFIVVLNEILVIRCTHFLRKDFQFALKYHQLNWVTVQFVTIEIVLNVYIEDNL